MEIAIPGFDTRLAKIQGDGTWGPGIKPNRIHMFIGRRGSGKSTGLKAMLYILRSHFKSGVCMSGTEDSNNFYSSIIPASYIYNDYDPAVVKNMVKRQRRARKAGRTPDHTFLVLEDVMHDSQTLAKDKYLKYLFMNGRHINCTVFLSSQFVLSLPPSFRGQIDYAYVFKCNIRRDRERLWDHFFGCFDDYNTFAQVLDQTTESYECLVLDQTGNKSDVASMCSWWKASPDIPPFKLGSRAYWQFHLLHYDPDAGNSDSEEDIAPKKPRVTVRRV